MAEQGRIHRPLERTQRARESQPSPRAYQPRWTKRTVDDDDRPETPKRVKRAGPEVVDLTSPLQKAAASSQLSQAAATAPTPESSSTPENTLVHDRHSGAVDEPPTTPASSPANETDGLQPVPVVEPTLCPEQQALVDLIMSGKNVFYTGSAGCGKSTVLKAFTSQLRDMGKRVWIAAPTGCAALQACHIHRYRPFHCVAF